MGRDEAYWQRNMVSHRGTRPPERSDIVWITLDPARGHEQAGRRPVVVLSSTAFNRACGLALVVPVTSKHKGYSNEVLITTKEITGAVLTSHIRAIDWKARRTEYIDTCPREALREIQAMCATYISGD